MEGKINEYGNLMLNREGNWLVQFCPYRTNTECGNDCPLFGEVQTSQARKFTLSLCRKELVFDSFKNDWDEKQKD